MEEKMEILKWIIFIIFVVVVSTLSLFLYCGLKLSSKYSRLEEEKYKEELRGNSIKNNEVIINRLKR